jgi:hypothetical protein
MNAEQIAKVSQVRNVVAARGDSTMVYDAALNGHPVAVERVMFEVFGHVPAYLRPRAPVANAHRGESPCEVCGAPDGCAHDVGCPEVQS